MAVGGAVAGAILGGWDGGFSGALKGAGIGFVMGATMAAGIDTFGMNFAFAAITLSAVYAGATGGLEGLADFAGGMIGSAYGTIVGNALVNPSGAAQTDITQTLEGDETTTSVSKQYALAVDQAEFQSPPLVDDDPPVEIYYRGLENKQGEPRGARLHPFMRETWDEGNFYELQRVKGKIKILEGPIEKMSKGTQAYWKSNPKPDKIIMVSKSKFYKAIENYKAKYVDENYYLLFRNSRGFVNYVKEHSEYGKQ